jgi:sugar lactone lactonase YvrE
MTTMAKRAEAARGAGALLLAALGFVGCATAREAGPPDAPRLGPERVFAIANGYAGGALDYRRQAFDGAAEGYQRALAFNPLDDAAAYLAAASWARAGNTDAALEFLNDVWRLDSCLVPTPKSFEAIADEPRFAEMRALLAAQAPKSHRSSAAFTLAERDLVPAGIAYDPLGKAFYVASLRKRKILRVVPPARTGPASVADFGSPSPDGLDAVLAVKVDAGRRRLWAVTGVDPAMEGFRPEDFGRSALVAFDLETGRRVGRWRPLSDPPHLFGDLAVGPAGEVFVTDTVSGEVYVLRPGASVLDVLVRRETFLAPKGIAVSSDGSRLYVSDLARGVFLVDPTTGAASVLDQPPGPWPIALEGLVLDGDALVGVAATLSRGRVGRWILTPDGRAARRSEILDCAHPAYRVPAGGTLVGGDYVYLANSQVDAFGGEGEPPSPESLADVVVLRLPLKP